MRKSKKIVLTIALACVCLGLVIGVIGLVKINFDFSKLNAWETKSVTYTVEDEFSGISVNSTGQNVRFVLSETGENKVVATETEKVRYSVQVENGVLKIQRIDGRAWYDYIRLIAWESGTVEVHLSKATYTSLTVKGNTSDLYIPKDFTFDQANIVTDTGDVNMYASVKNKLTISTDTGDITVENIEPTEIALSVDTGKVLLRNVKAAQTLSAEADTGNLQFINVECARLELEVDTGDVYLKNVISSGHVSIETDTGDVTILSCDGASWEIETDTGDVKGSLRSEKDFRAYSSTGTVRVPNNASGGVCSVKSSTGDIILKVE